MIIRQKGPGWEHEVVGKVYSDRPRPCAHVKGGWVARRQRRRNLPNGAGLDEQTRSAEAAARIGFWLSR